MLKSIPCVYDGHLSTLSSKDFNTVKMTLTAKLDSDLSWKKQEKEANEICDKGLNILWNLDLGLFSELPLPLSDTTQYKSLHLALDHFFETVWTQFEPNTVGAVLFKGSIDLRGKWSWDPDQILNLQNEITSLFKDENALHNKIGIPCKDLMEITPKELDQTEYGRNILRFICLDSALDYLEILAARFPDSLLPYVLLDAKPISSKFHLAQLLDHEAFDFVQLGLKQAPIHVAHAIGWETSGYPNGFIGTGSYSLKETHADSSVGVVVPQKKVYDPEKLKQYDKALDWLTAKEQLRYISERNLTMDWSGLDTLLVFEGNEFLNRKLEGFIAAGGTVVGLQQKLGLSQEITYKEFKTQLEVS